MQDTTITREVYMMAAAHQNQIILKVDDGLMERIKRFTEWLSAQQPSGLKVSRADAIRVLLHRGLGEFAHDAASQEAPQGQ
jgi:hypothetical protein